MRHKHVKILIILIFLISAISAVSAQSDDSNSTELTFESDDTIIQEAEIIEESELIPEECEIDVDDDEEILDVSDEDVLSQPGSFTSLSNTISSSSSKLTLKNDYKCSSGENDVMIYGKNNFVLDGDGHEIDFNNQNARFLVYSSNVTLNNITFKNAGYVSVMWISSGGTLTNCEFISNHGSQASALIWYGHNGLIENVTFANNTASNSIGAAAILGSNNVLDNVTFINNSAPICGALALDIGYGARNNTVKNSRFINNTATAGFSGGLYDTGTSTLIENSVFMGNAARAGSGGGLYFVGAKNALINNCTIINNSANYAGGIYLNGTGNILNDSVIENNRAYSGAGGFLIGENSQVSNSTFKNNIAVYGGGGLTSIAKASPISNCTFTNNTAGNYGGGLSIWENEVVSSTFTNNSAIYGGGIFTVNSTIKDSKFINNNAPHAKSIFAVDDIELESDVGEDEIIRKYEKDTVRTLEEQYGFFIALENGYYGFCVEKNNSPPYYSIETENMTIIRNSLNHEDVHDYLKILFYVFVDHLDDVEKHDIQDLVWIFTNEDFRQSGDEKIQKTIELYDSGFRVENHNATKILKNGSLMVFNFLSLVTPSSEQNMFIFKFEYTNVTNQTVEKKALNKTVFVGDEFRYEITVKNNGELVLNDIYIEDNDFSSNMEFVKAVNGTGIWKYSNETAEVFRFNMTNLTQSEYRNISSRWILTTPLKPGENATIILIFKALSNGTAVNNVTSGMDMLELVNDTNNETRIYNPNLTVQKISLNPVVVKDSLTTFKIIVTNTGDFDLTDVFVVESDYAGLEYYSFEGAGWNRTANKFTYLNTLKAGENASFNVTFKAPKAGNFTNIVVAGSNETGNNTANNTTSVLKPELDVSKITVTPTVTVGQKAVFEIVVKNTGEVDLENVFVIEDIHDGSLVYLDYTSENRSWSHSLNNENKHQFTLNEILKVGESSSFRVIFNTTRIGNFSNTVTAGYNNTNITNSTNTTEVVNKTTPENKTNPQKNETPKDKAHPKTEKTPKDKTTPKTKKTQKNSKPKTNKQKNPKKTFDHKKSIDTKLESNASGNPLLILLLSLAIVSIRRFRL